MRVLGIDPGFDRLGVALLERVGGEDTVRFSRCLQSLRGESLPRRLAWVGEQLEQVLNEHRPTAVAIETLFFNKNVKTAIDVAQARGVVLYLAQKYGATVCEYSPQAVKVAVTGHGQSDKTAVIAMVRRLAANVPEQALDDEYDAIAIGITYLAHNRGGR